GKLNTDEKVRWIALRIPNTSGIFDAEDGDFEATAEKETKKQIQQMIARQALVYALDSSVDMDTIYNELLGQQYKEYKDIAEITVGDYKIVETSSENFNIFVISTVDDEVDLTDYM
ncbi:MAG TPA: hypothetical protein VNR38_20705, partial [Ureibacillus sp.]|nr:hypothetical protein [Ureibacillus sp.]